MTRYDITHKGVTCLAVEWNSERPLYLLRYEGEIYSHYGPRSISHIADTDEIRAAIDVFLDMMEVETPADTKCKDIPLAIEMSRAVSSAIRSYYLENEEKLEAVLRSHGWCKKSELLAEVFEQLNRIKHDHSGGYIDDSEMYRQLSELEQKYT